MKHISKVTEFYCIADDFYKEYELELNKRHRTFNIEMQTARIQVNFEDVGKTTFTFNTEGLNWDFPN